ncbi:hypothetical protein AAA799P11_01235 [Marine Group I thaumarchaeote SCGC AAA799-P11]|uniref:Carbohydrate-binding domain-containing protein n=1 Tax=Marine Group I thaumarchaeote SCGC AAA799-P11 TaxID=1502295 RepID=A0A087RX74_9ARCH|nr:hypothetical protein AAA799P11_01235 [Marine Group I thaumarchaeote SCGC AAA799-P11]
MKTTFFLIVILLMMPITSFAYEPIPITYSADRASVIFDGKWSFFTEWKESTLTDMGNENAQIKLRTAHQNDFIYVLVDFVSDVHLDKKIDMSIICFDSENNKSKLSDENDFCFSVSLGSENGFIYQGGSPFALKQNFEKIYHPDFIAIGGVSDENDRYSKTPHTSYEFKIPLELIGRENVYGFYVGVHDSYTKTTYTWPENIPVDTFTKIAKPNHWGEIYSPDKSLPEFEIPLLIITFSIIFYLVLVNRKPFSMLQK